METVKVKPSELRDGDQLLIDGAIMTIRKIHRDFDGFCMMFDSKVVFTNDKWNEELILS